MATMRIHDQHGNLVTLIVHERRIIGANVSDTRVHYVGGAHVANLATIVDSSLGGDARAIELPFDITLCSDGLLKDGVDFCHFDNPYMPDWLLGTRNGDGTIILKDENEHTSSEPVA